MLVLDSNYQAAITALGYNWDMFPLTYLATWGSTVTLDSAIQTVTFAETAILDVLNTNDAKQILVEGDENRVVADVDTGFIESSIPASRVESTVNEPQI